MGSRDDKSFGREEGGNIEGEAIRQPHVPVQKYRPLKTMGEWARGALGNLFLAGMGVGSVAPAISVPVQGAESDIYQTYKGHPTETSGHFVMFMVIDGIAGKKGAPWKVRFIGKEHRLNRKKSPTGVYCIEYPEGRPGHAYYFLDSKKNEFTLIKIEDPMARDAQVAGDTSPQQPVENNAVPASPVQTGGVEGQQQTPSIFRSPDAEMLEAEKAVQELGYLTFEYNHDYDPANERQSFLRLPPLIPPDGFKPIYAEIRAVIEDGNTCKALMPLPTRIGGQLPVAVLDVTIRKSRGGTLKPKSVNIVYGRNGFRNPYLEVDIGNNPATGGRLEISIGVLALLPEHPSLFAERNANQKQVERNQASIANQILDQIDPRKAAVEKQKAINEIFLAKIDPQQASIIGNAAAAAADINWTPIKDCGYKARELSKNAPGAQVATGFSFKMKDRKFGFRHSLNMAKAKDSSGYDRQFMIDARDPEELYMGPQHDFLVTGVGEEDVVPNGGRLHRALEGTNGGLFFGINNNEIIQPAHLHSWRKMEMPRTEEKKRLGPVVDYAKHLWDNYKEVSGGPQKVAKKGR